MSKYIIMLIKFLLPLQNQRIYGIYEQKKIFIVNNNNNNNNIDNY